MATNCAFCEFDNNEFSDLSNLLATIFEFQAVELYQQYTNWRKNLNSGQPVEDIPMNYKSCDPIFQQFVESSEVVGVDLPITLDMGQRPLTASTVMFVAQDPRRDPRFARSPKITLGTPFAFHSPWGREQGTTTRLVFQAAQYWLDKGWRVYLTDSVKIYAFDEAKGKARGLPKGDCEKFDALLSAEINLFNPKLIVAIGAIAKRAVRQISPGIPLVAVPHFSGANQERWKQILGPDQRATNAAKLEWYRQEVEKVISVS